VQDSVDWLARQAWPKATISASFILKKKIFVLIFMAVSSIERPSGLHQELTDIASTFLCSEQRRICGGTKNSLVYFIAVLLFIHALIIITFIWWSNNKTTHMPLLTQISGTISCNQEDNVHIVLISRQRRIRFPAIKIKRMSWRFDLAHLSVFPKSV